MTPVLLTDADIALLLKSEAACAKERLLMDLKTTCKERGVRNKFRCGHYEMIRIVRDALVGTAETLHTRDTFFLFEEERHVGMAA